MPLDKTIRILVVDDFENVARTLQSQLRQLGFSKVEVAAGGPTALAKLKEAKDFGLILADWIMPEVNGLDLLKEVRGDQKLKNVPFIMVTGNTNPEDVAAAKKAGVTSYIIKPYNMATLKQRLEATFGPLN
jgi:two-component system, chemotaxis family, chemotaxis protein CheY